MYWSTVQTRNTALPSGRLPVGMSRAPGANSERKRSQSRFWPAGPEITSYTASMMLSSVVTSPGRAVVVPAWSIWVQCSDATCQPRLASTRVRLQRWLSAKLCVPMRPRANQRDSTTAEFPVRCTASWERSQPPSL
jgi:hypothetical protein